MDTRPPHLQDRMTATSAGRTGACLVDQCKASIGPADAYYALVPLLSGPVSNHSIKHGFDSGKTIDLELRPDQILCMRCHIQLVDPDRTALCPGCNAASQKPKGFLPSPENGLTLRGRQAAIKSLR